MMRDTSLNFALANRRSTREFSEEAISLGELTAILWAAQGHTDAEGRRTVPSASSTFPLKIFVSIGNVQDIATGVFIFDSLTCELLSVDQRDVRNDLCAAAIGEQPWVEEAAVVLTICADIAKSVCSFAQQEPFGRRGIAYAYLEAGGAVQNALLQATSLGLGSVVLGGFADHATSQALQVTAPFEPLVHVCIGSKR